MNKYHKFSLIIFIGIIVDFFSKIIFKGKDINIIPKIFKIQYDQNPGLVFGLFEKSFFFTIIIPILVVLIIGYYFYKNELEWIGSSLIIAGLIGNLIDRIFYGYVIDWIFIMIYPAYNISLFNIADSLLIAGVIISVYKINKK